MTLKKDFTLEAAEKPKANNVIYIRRRKFIAGVARQFMTVPGGNTTVLSRTSTWVWQSDDGVWFITPRYGRATLELAPGLNSIKCSGSGDVVNNLEKLKTLTVEGKMDPVLTAAAAKNDIRIGKQMTTLVGLESAMQM
jgi:hypothetical protein